MERNRTHIVNAISDGKIFSVTFIKRTTGLVRKMVCRVGVYNHLSGGEPAYDAGENNLITVFDMQKKAYRSISVESILEMRVHGQTFAWPVIETVVTLQGSSALVRRGEFTGSIKLLKNGNCRTQKAVTELLGATRIAEIEIQLRGN